MAQRVDYQAAGFPSIANWSQPSLEENIQQVAAYAEAQAQNAIAWYFQGRKSRRRLCQICRVLAILLTAAAGILPIVADIYPNCGVKPLHATLSLAVAGVWVALDRFWGFTSGWVRYMQTGQQISDLLEQFRFDFGQSRLNWANGQPTLEQAQTTLVRIRTFVLQVNLVVEEETKAWAAEFAAALKAFDEQAKTLADTVRKSVIQLHVTNGDQSAGWTVVLDGGAPVAKTGKQAALTVFPGIHTVTIGGQVGGKNLSAEQAVDVKAGTVANLELTLV